MAKYRAQCAFCPGGCSVTTEADAQRWANHHSKALDHVAIVSVVRA